MKLAYLTDAPAVGGGGEYINRQIAAHPNDECRVFYSSRGECKAQTIADWGAEFVHVNHLRALMQYFRKPARISSAKVVFTVHGIHLRKYDFLPRTLTNLAKRFLRRNLERTLYRKCDELIALTQTDADDLKRFYGDKLPPIRIEPNTIDPEELKGLDFAPRSYAYVCIGRFDFQKGQDLWLSHVAANQDEMRKRGGTTLFIGGGKTLEECKLFAKQNGIDDLVEFAGEIPNAERFLKCADAVVAPSRWEGMPYLILKAKALDCRIIASDCPGNKDVLDGYPKWEKFK